MEVFGVCMLQCEGDVLNEGAAESLCTAVGIGLAFANAQDFALKAFMALITPLM